MWQKRWLGLALAVGLGGVLVLRLSSKPVAAPAPQPVASLQFQVFEQPTVTIYALTVPAHAAFVVRPFLANSVATVAEVASQTQAIAVINAGFFDPANQKTTSPITINGQLVADPRANERLMQNPQLTSYLDAILNRSELRIYQCQGQVKYAIARHAATLVQGCTLVHAVGGGPQLLPVDTSQSEAFTDYAQGSLVRDALGSVQPNSRTAVGIKADGALVWVMAAQKSTTTESSGLTLAALTQFFRSMGIQSALNLDGGSSSSLFYRTQTYYGHRDQAGAPVMRSVKSFLVLQPQ